MTYTHEDYLRDKEVAMIACKGDKARYDVAHKKVVGAGISWSDIEVYAAVYPNHEQRSRALISKHLGYLPHDNIIIPHETFLRTLIEQFNMGQISESAFESQAIRHIQHIRNDDINKFGWADKTRYTWQEITDYNNFLPQFEAPVHAKIIQYFGVLPAIDHIIEADKMLRQVMNQHQDLITDKFLPVDFKAFAIIAYRKALAEKGRDAANELPLIKIH